MTRRSAHRAEHTGNAQIDRVQSNVRDLQAFAKGELADLAWFHGVGVKRIQMRDATYTMSLDELRAGTLIFDGPLTAPRNVILPRVPDARAFQRWVRNATGQALVFVNSDGSTTLTSAAGVGYVVVNADGPTRYL